MNQPNASNSHSHCVSCFRSNCSARRSAESCSIMRCHKCGVLLHECKLSEHVEETCPESVVTCINVGNGCGLLMKRRVLGIHLELCPASIVICSVEWNRWPLHYVDKHSPLPFFLPNPQGYPEQLDIALALRDQAMLNAAYEAPRHFRRMRNELTERFPAVPLPTARQVPVSILRERELMAVPNGVNGAVTGGWSRDTSIDSDSQSTVSGLTSEDDFSWSDTPWQKRRNPPGLSRSLCSKLYQASRQTTETLKVALQMITEGHDNSDDERLREVESNNGDSIDDQAPSEFGDSTVGSDKAVYALEFSITSQAMEEGDDVTLATAEEFTSSVVPPAPPAHAAIALGVNVVVESITRYQTKPKSMLTFVCGQSFRRSEYAAHYRNVHSEIQGGLTWIEQRCPLAQYGCPFSHRRVYPGQPKNAALIHSTDLQSFGVHHVDDPAHLPHNAEEDYLSQMPEEILLRIGHFLDGFALNNFSRVSRRLRFSCLSLLEEKGMVHQEWNKIGRGRWRIEFQRWMFSTAFDEVVQWKLNSRSVGEHLRCCPFFHRVRHLSPIQLPALAESDTCASEQMLAKLTEHSKKFSGDGDEVIQLTDWRPSKTSVSCDTPSLP
ncbi:putative F-box only protein 30 [Hypsibius exemplaris]|uniref:F-box only protein 30 n=1 Tax=Hypsibius exemplaris TaxID=2072580 RepID=A0A1W0X3C4_HYPEX|nr:putative F-box only protein 30 [Hypsibius exemplaris]